MLPKGIANPLITPIIQKHSRRIEEGADRRGLDTMSVGLQGIGGEERLFDARIQ
jgi:hypothetical protein